MFENITSKDVQLPERFSSQARDFFKCSTHRNVSQRMTVYEMLAHPWIRTNAATIEASELEEAATYSGNIPVSSRQNRKVVTWSSKCFFCDLQSVADSANDGAELRVRHALTDIRHNCKMAPVHSQQISSRSAKSSKLALRRLNLLLNDIAWPKRH